MMTVLSPCWAREEAKLRTTNVLPSEGKALVKRKLRNSDSFPRSEIDVRRLRNASASAEAGASKSQQGMALTCF